MEKALVVRKLNFWSTKLGKILLMVVSPLIVFIIMCICSVLWIAALLVVFIVMVCAAPFFAWVWNERKMLEFEAKLRRRNQK